MTSTTLSQKWDRLGKWFDDNWRGVLLVGLGLVIGLALGWWGGSWLSCSRSDSGCEARPDSIEAAGTWVGGIGTILAVLAAVAAFRSEEASRRRQTELQKVDAREHEKQVLADAKRVRISCSANSRTAGHIVGFDMYVSNKTTETQIYEVAFTGPFAAASECHTVRPGKFHRTVYNQGSWTMPDDLDGTNGPVFQNWAIERSSVTFVMHGRYWRRSGHDEPECIEEWEVHGHDAPE